MSAQQLQLRISISIYDTQGQGHLEVREEFVIKGGLSFLEVARVLGALKDTVDAQTAGLERVR